MVAVGSVLSNSKVFSKSENAKLSKELPARSFENSLAQTNPSQVNPSEFTYTELESITWYHVLASSVESINVIGLIIDVFIVLNVSISAPHSEVSEL